MSLHPQARAHSFRLISMQNMKKIGFLAACLLFIVSCQAVPSETAEEPKALLCHSENCKENLVSLIKSSREVVCAFYDLDSEEIVRALNEKNALAVIEWDNRNSINAKLLHKKYDLSPYLMHNKFCVFDNRFVWTGSWNPTNKNHYDNVIILYSGYLAKNYKQEFNELWSNRHERVLFPKIVLNNKDVQNYFCPEDHCADRVMEELKKARQSIHFMLFSFTDHNLGELLAEKAKDVKVRGILEKSQMGRWSESERLKDYTRIYRGSGILHHKLFIIDNETVITGSYNPTAAGNEKNDENVIIIQNREIATVFLKEFEELWDRAFLP